MQHFHFNILFLTVWFLFVHQIAVQHSLNTMKNENTIRDDLIEIYDSDDDNHSDTRPAIDETNDHMKLNMKNDVLRNGINNKNTDDTQNGADSDHENEPKLSVEAESNDGNVDGTMIEICDSDDDGTTKTNKKNSDDTRIGTANVDHENEVKPSVKYEPNADSASELVDIPLVEFDPSKENNRVVSVLIKAQNSKTHRTNADSNQSKSSVVGKRFKCEHCDRSFQFKCILKHHQPLHANGNLIGIKADSNGLYKCTHCIRRFSDVHHLSRHIKLTHRNDQYLYDCAHCMRQFVRKANKDKHENQCNGHHYECHLCKVYVTKVRNHMQRHMRMHTGATPFRCMVCRKSFQQKYSLIRHLNNIHSR